MDYITQGELVKQRIEKVTKLLDIGWKKIGGRPSFDNADYFAAYAAFLIRYGSDIRHCLLLAPQYEQESLPPVFQSKQFAAAVLEKDLSYATTSCPSFFEEAAVEVADEICRLVSEKDLLSYLAYAETSRGPFRGESTTAPSICDLAIKLLDIHDGDSVADLCCGEGRFLLRAIEVNGAAAYTGVEIDNLSFLVSGIRFRALNVLRTFSSAYSTLPSEESLYDALNGSSADIIGSCAFDLKQQDDVRYDKVFSNHPLGIRFRNINWYNDGNELFEKRISQFGEPASADWIFTWNALDCIAGDGKAVVLMACGSACNKREASIRREFVESGAIECVIALPDKMHAGTNISSLMLVVSHKNKEVRFVDATKTYQKGRRKNGFSPQDIEVIASACASDSNISASVTVEDIKACGWDLTPSTYLQEEIVVENGVELERLAIELGRGAIVEASTLDEEADSGCAEARYLRLQDISDGRISSNLPGLSSVSGKMRPSLLRDGDLIISRSAPIKIAVADIEEGEDVVAIGNLYIARFDKSKINPLYVMAFLCSDKGSQLLSRACSQNGIQGLPIEKLKKIPIPLIPKEAQDETASRFAAKLDAIAITKAKLEALRSDLSDICGVS